MVVLVRKQGAAHHFLLKWAQDIKDFTMPVKTYELMQNDGRNLRRKKNNSKVKMGFYLRERRFSTYVVLPAVLARSASFSSFSL